MPQRLYLPIYYSNQNPLYIGLKGTQGGSQLLNCLREEFRAVFLSSLGLTEDLHARRVVKTPKNS